MSGAAAKVPMGVLVAVVGPSGAGKDTVIDFARSRMGGRAAFVRRVITRASDAGSEIHDSLTPEAFAAAAGADAFLLTWEAHGLSYGIPAQAADEVAKGRVVVANLSRGAIDEARSKLARVHVVEVTAQPEILAERLAARGREGTGEATARLARKVAGPVSRADTVIDNSGEREEAGGQFVALLETLLQQKP